MNKLYTIVLSFVLLIFINACTDDEGNPITNPTDLVPSMSATVNGEAWTATGAPAAVDSAGFLYVTGYNNDDSSSILIQIANPEEKTYSFGDSTSDASAYYGGFSSGFNFASSGSLEITKYNAGQLISGNFSFSTDSTFVGSAKTVTDGRMNNVVVVVK
ncbi:MAG: DUF6252 family protein [Cytophagales bacterium]